MAARDESTLPATRRPKSRKSIAGIPQSDQENMTVDLSALSGKRAPTTEKAGKKSRSKSIGPGGLDALIDSSGNRRKSLASIPQLPPRSILKPTMPPLQEIPAHFSARSPRKTSTALVAATPPVSNANMLIDFSLDPPTKTNVTGNENLENPFQINGNTAINETRVTLRTEEEQQAAAREREEKERADQEKENKSRREARRKSLANRRVSFAPEATLHTWDVVVEYQDSTTSSASTNSTRRASSTSGGEPSTPYSQTPDFTSSDPSEPPSTPPEQVEEDTATASPAHQRDLHQKKRRRSSGIPPMNFNNPDEAFSSSPYSGSSVEGTEVEVEEDASEGNSDSDDDDGTAMSLDGGNTTDMSMASDTGSSARLEEALRTAARQASTHGSEIRRDEDTAMADDEDIIASFAPWAKKNSPPNLESQKDQENLNPFSPAFKAGAIEGGSEADSSGDEMTMDMTHAVGGIIQNQPQDDEMSMDVTRAFGGIISNEAQNRGMSAPNLTTSTGRQNVQRRSSSGSSSSNDETMDLTTAIGGIHPPQVDQLEDDDDMTMELTTVVGGVLPEGNASKNRRKSPTSGSLGTRKRQARESMDSAAGDETMDMTMAMGGIMPSVDENTSELDATMGMEMTTALGGILPSQMTISDRSEAKKFMELETDLGSSPFRIDVLPSPAKLPLPNHTVAMASETDSPSLAVSRAKGLRRSIEARNSNTPRSKEHVTTPIKKPTTPSKQLTPRPVRPTTPGKTPPSKDVVMRTSSPKRLFKDQIKTASTTPQSRSKSSTTPNRLFQQNGSAGVATPSVILSPQRRISTGIGLDREGLGSPSVAAILDRRASIGELARVFKPSSFDDGARGVRFDSPRKMEEELDRERQQEEDRENSRTILEREADHIPEEKDTTLNLKEMIQSMTPKKKSMRGRKSLHVGAAKGILGKRPAELDEDDEDDEDEGGVKRLKNFQGSPVKNIKLPLPPSKEETTNGRTTRASRKSTETPNESFTTPTTSSSPVKGATVTTPHGQGRFKDAEAQSSPRKIAPPAEKEPTENPQIDEASLGDDRIQLQDFLNMTSIRFMELTTTKRRHTIAAKNDSVKDQTSEESRWSFEDCVAAGASTITMLELFQHQCQELKSYISEGRRTIRLIESDTYEDNPPLFQEYISATPDVKIIMDNQLKNVKTNSRLVSKSMWYEWRMKLLRTVLDDGLLKMAREMTEDGRVLDHQQSLLDSVLPQLVEKADALAAEEAELLTSAEELARCDPEDLSDARHRLISVDADVAAKEQRIAELQKQLQGKEAEIASCTERKQNCVAEIHEAERIREECRGWTSNEVATLKAKVNQIEEKHGWTITGVSGTFTSMSYRKDIELVFDASAFLSQADTTAQPTSSRIDLWYIGSNKTLAPRPKTDEVNFFTSSILDHVRGLDQSQISAKTLLDTVSEAWRKANAIFNEIRMHSLTCPSKISKTSDTSILIKSNLLIVPLATKVDICMELVSHSTKSGLEFEIRPSAKVVYGERFNEPKMAEYLLNRVGDRVEITRKEDEVSWADAVSELAERLLARGRK
ncbi:Spc7 kinetochore protein [Phlyctema vagabunda]|uniref:Spc7 kinetochore protein n=1 Tax=Phlyctema vagabunda TaxID=108571 RepID=A0ABR4P636_9HELO